MKNHFRNPRPATGFTLIELMVVMVVVAALLVVVIPSMTTFKRDAELTSVTNNLMGAINTARGEAMKRAMRAVVAPMQGNDWTSGWVVFIDQNRNNAYDSATDTTVFQQGPLSSTVLSIAGSTTAADPAGAYLMFDGSGYARTRANNGFTAATLTIRRTDSDSMRRIKISQTGRVRSCKPASATDPDCDDTED